MYAAVVAIRDDDLGPKSQPQRLLAKQNSNSEIDKRSLSAVGHQSQFDAGVVGSLAATSSLNGAATVGVGSTPSKDGGNHALELDDIGKVNLPVFDDGSSFVLTSDLSVDSASLVSDPVDSDGVLSKDPGICDAVVSSVPAVFDSVFSSLPAVTSSSDCAVDGSHETPDPELVVIAPSSHPSVAVSLSTTSHAVDVSATSLADAVDSWCPSIDVSAVSQDPKVGDFSELSDPVLVDSKPPFSPAAFLSAASSGVCVGVSDETSNPEVGINVVTPGHTVVVSVQTSAADTCPVSSGNCVGVADDMSDSDVGIISLPSDPTVVVSEPSTIHVVSASAVSSDADVDSSGPSIDVSDVSNNPAAHENAECLEHVDVGSASVTIPDDEVSAPSSTAAVELVRPSVDFAAVFINTAVSESLECSDDVVVDSVPIVASTVDVSLSSVIVVSASSDSPLSVSHISSDLADENPETTFLLHHSACDNVSRDQVAAEVAPLIPSPPLETIVSSEASDANEVRSDSRKHTVESVVAEDSVGSRDYAAADQCDDSISLVEPNVVSNASVAESSIGAETETTSLHVAAHDLAHGLVHSDAVSVKGVEHLSATDPTDSAATMPAFSTQPVNVVDITAVQINAQYSSGSPLSTGTQHIAHNAGDMTSDDRLFAKELQWDAALASNANDDLKRIWRSMDDGNGRLSLSELDGWFKRKHPNRYFPAVIKHAFSISKNAKGYVDSNEFRRFLINIIRCLRAWVDWDTANQSVDSKRVDSNGKATKDRRLDFSEFQRYFSGKYPTSNAASCKREWGQLDVDRTGMALFGDFCSWFVKRVAPGFDLGAEVAPPPVMVASTKPIEVEITPSLPVPSVRAQAISAYENVVNCSDVAAGGGLIGPSADASSINSATHLPENAEVVVNKATSTIEAQIEERPGLEDQMTPLQSLHTGDDATVQEQPSSESFSENSADRLPFYRDTVLLAAQATVSLVRYFS
jgi:hypothetical protein